MAAPVGNQFWKQRAKHGRDKIFESPENLWDAACEYFEWCDAHPMMEQVIEKLRVNGFGDKVSKEELPKMRAYTWEGLELFLDVSSLRNYKTNDEYKDFFQVITRIEKIIYTQKFTGAAAGFLNPNIIARDLGLVDKKENKVSVEQPLFGDESDEGDNSQEGA